MNMRFLTSLKESPFIEGMGRVLDFLGIINGDPQPTKTDAEALNDDWGKVLGDYSDSIIIIRTQNHVKKKKIHPRY
jgi:hypothetical protein